MMPASIEMINYYFLQISGEGPPLPGVATSSAFEVLRLRLTGCVCEHTMQLCPSIYGRCYSAEILCIRDAVLLKYIRALLFCLVPQQFVYDTLSTDISSTTVYQRQKIIIFINSNFYLQYDSFYRSHFHYDNTTYIVSKHCGMTIQLVLSVKDAYFYQSHF